MANLATVRGAPSPGPWTVERWKGKDGSPNGISIKDANGLFIANMIQQPGDNEYANACRIVSAVNQYLAPDTARNGKGANQ